jgi:hypothetical protein
VYRPVIGELLALVCNEYLARLRSEQGTGLLALGGAAREKGPVLSGSRHEQATRLARETVENAVKPA